jgi:hypothetical protein
MRAPVLAVGDGALGFWAALRDVFPDTRSSGAGSTRSATCWQRPAEVGPPGAKKPRWPRSGTPRTSDHAEAAAKAFAADYGAKWPKAAAKITDDLDVLLAFYDYPAEHWVHLRTTNPIESTFATVRLRQRVTKGPGSRAAGIAMAFKLIESAPRPAGARSTPPPRRPRPRRRHLRERQTRRTTRLILVGVIGILCGILTLFAPASVLTTAAIMFGALALVYGIAAIIASLRLRSLVKQAGSLVKQADAAA